LLEIKNGNYDEDILERALELGMDILEWSWKNN
jgi:hypothetical protein